MPANDSFSNLVSFKSTNSSNSLSLQEQQRRLEELKAMQEDERRKLLDTQFGVQGLPSRHTVANGVGGNGAQKLSSAINKPFASIGTASLLQPANDEDDILAAFNSTEPVDISSNFPIPSNGSFGRSTPNLDHAGSVQRTVPRLALLDLDGHNSHQGLVPEDEDDPFGLGQSNQIRVSSAASRVNETDEDDVLGLLGRPVSELPSQASVDHQNPPDSDDSVAHGRSEVHLQDKAIAELVDMGFSAVKARDALSQTDSGVDIQAAVGWLLSHAHEESRRKPRGRASPENRRRQSSDRSAEPSGQKLAKTEDLRGDSGMPGWMRRESRSNSSQRRQDSRSPANGDKDAAKYAAEIGSNLFKSANSLWKTGAKKMQQAVSEFNSDSDSNQPKWMRSNIDGDVRRQKPSRAPIRGEFETEGGDKVRSEAVSERRARDVVQRENITDEALMLESTDSRPAPKVMSRSRPADPRTPPSSISPREQSSTMLPRSVVRQSSNSGYLPRHLMNEVPKVKLSRQALDDQASVAYVSPARRKRPPPKPAESEPNLLLTGSTAPSLAPRSFSTVPRVQQNSDSPLRRPLTSAGSSAHRPAHPKIPPRKIPSVSASTLTSSTTCRKQGTDAFKLGDYAAAHSAYTSALTLLPDRHPILIIILCNRALTSLKIGEPKAAVSDADAALSLIGPSHGEGETVALGHDEGSKEMRDFYGKALMRKAEALEQMERWDDAAKVWREAVESGHGGSTSIQGRNRSEKAAGRGADNAVPVTHRQALAKKAPPLRRQTAASTAPSAEAVTRLRAANAAAERADDEKFALADSVDAKLSAWKNGKQDNLRALLGSLDTVLWPEAGWKKVGLHELVLANKVKVVYMKGIAKVHPDKVRLLPRCYNMFS